MSTYQGGSSSEEEEVESSISETKGEIAPHPREGRGSEQTKPTRRSRKRKRGDRTASSSLLSADSTRKSPKVVIEYSTDETDEDKITDMRGKGYEFPRKTTKVKLTLPATTPSQVTLARTFVKWFSYYGMRAGMREALEKRGWTEDMVNEFIENFREKHGFNEQPCCLHRLRRRIISPRESSMQEDQEDKLEDLAGPSRKRSKRGRSKEAEEGEEGQGI